MLGSWQHRTTGKRVEVVSMRGDSVGLVHESGRQSSRLLHYFMEDYRRAKGEHGIGQAFYANTPHGKRRLCFVRT